MGATGLARARGLVLACVGVAACGDEAAAWRAGREAEEAACLARATGAPFLPREHYYGQRVSAGATATWSLAGGGDICLVSQHAAHEDPVAEITCRNHAEYARVHDIPYTRHRGPLAAADGVPPPGPAWQKFLALAHALAGPRGERAPCRWAVWVDVRLVFTHLERSLGEVLAPFESAELNPYGLDRDVVLARREDGASGCPFATGAIAVRNSAGGHAFLAALSARRGDYGGRDHGDEAALRDWALGRPSGTPAPTESWERLAPSLRAEVGAVRQRVLGGFFGHGVVDGHGGTWRDQDLAAHLRAPDDAAARRLAEHLLQALARPDGQRSPRRVRPPEKD